MGRYYKKIEQLVSKDACEMLAGAFLIMEHNTPIEKRGDSITPEAFSRYGYSAADSLQYYVKPKIESVLGRELIPTFTYCRIYRNGHRLPQHMDRPSCEIAVSLNLKNDGVSWPITLGVLEPEDVYLEQGDAVVYEGKNVLHKRLPFEGNEHVQLFMCYVYADGDNTDYAHDKRLDAYNPF